MTMLKLAEIASIVLIGSGIQTVLSFVLYMIILKSSANAR